MMLIWKDEMAYGIDAIDTHHRTILEMINLLENGMESDQDVEREYQALIAAELEHFRTEIAMMEAAGCSGLQKQKQEHEILLRKLNRNYEAYLEGASPLAHDIREFLDHWLEKHCHSLSRDDISRMRKQVNATSMTA